MPASRTDRGLPLLASEISEYGGLRIQLDRLGDGLRERLSVLSQLF